MEALHSVYQAIDVIAEDPVEAQPEKSVDLARVLSVPTQAPDAEPTKERH